MLGSGICSLWIASKSRMYLLKIWNFHRNYFSRTGPLPNPHIFCRVGPRYNMVQGETWPNMMTSSNENIFRVTGHLCGNSPVTGEFPTQRPVTRLVFSLICVWINGWVSNREAGDLRRYRAHYDVTVMQNAPHIPHISGYWASFIITVE